MNNTRTLSAAAALVAGILLLGSAVAPAAAAIPEPVKAAPIKPASQAKAPSEKQLYCVDVKMTGSRIAKRDCKTRADWLNQGFDPLNPDK